MPKKPKDTLGTNVGTDATMLWKFLCSRPDARWNVQRLTNHWAPSFSEEEVECHLKTLVSGKFIEQEDGEFGGADTFAFTRACRVLPGLEEFAKAASQTRTTGPIAPPPRHNKMSGTYRPGPKESMRPGADDHLAWRSAGMQC
jgi:hypothetical protein